MWIEFIIFETYIKYWCPICFHQMVKMNWLASTSFPTIDIICKHYIHNFVSSESELSLKGIL